MARKKSTIDWKEAGDTCNARIWLPDGTQGYCQEITYGRRCQKSGHSAGAGLAEKRWAGHRKCRAEDLGEPPAPAMTADAVWDEHPVDVLTFFSTFINEPLFPIQQEFADAMLGTNPSEWDARYNEGLALWGKGSGKDRTAAKILTYVCYKLLCMKDPIGYFNRGASSKARGVEDKIEVANVCINAQLAKAVFFKYFQMIVRNTINPATGKNWFEEKGLDLKKDILVRQIRFPKNITAYSLDSEEYTGEGLNLIFVIFDEIAGFEPMKARELYMALRSTCVSRFPQHWKILLLSYKRLDNDFMMIRFNEAEHEPKTYRRRAATWEVNTRRKKEEFLEEYARSFEDAQRVYECLGSTSEGGYIKFKERIAEVINSAKKEHPLVGEAWRVVNLRSLHFKDWFTPEPNTSYFVHVDLAKDKDGKGDACGLAMGHFKRDMAVTLPPRHIDLVRQLEGFDLTPVVGRQEVGAVIDLVLQIKAVPGGEIIFDEIREFIKRLRQELKFPIHRVTFDGWQSTDSIQLLRRDGTNAEELSVDRDNAAYDTLKSLIYRGIFECYYHPVLIRELEELIVTERGKVDHPNYGSRYSATEGGQIKASKDVADAVAGCARGCIEKGKTNFACWVSDTTGRQQTQHMPFKHPLRWESDRLVPYGDRAEYNKRLPF